MATPEGSRWAVALQTGPQSPALDLDDGIGQREASFVFDAVDIITGYRTRLTPLKNQTPTLEHDTTRVITRSISGLLFGKQDTAILNSIRSRLDIAMIFQDGSSWPLGRYMFNAQARSRYSSGLLSAGAFYDQMFIVDQQLEQSFSGLPQAPPLGGFPPGILVQDSIEKALDGLPIKFVVEPSPYVSTGAFPAGSHRGGQVLKELCIDGDYFNPWFDNKAILRFIRTFDPAKAAATFDFDSGNKVMAEPTPMESDNLIEAPNRIIVIGNGSSSIADSAAPIVGVYDIPASAPHSIASRGFVLPDVQTRQVEDNLQAAAVAANLGQRQTVFETAEVYTAPDPRHDGYDVIRWRGANWLELAWSLPLVEGAKMRHLMRKAYL